MEKLTPLEIIKNEGGALLSAFQYVVKNNSSSSAPYHNLNHMLQVMWYCDSGCIYHDIDGDQRTKLLIAALFHDFDHFQGEKPDNINILFAGLGLKRWCDSLSYEDELNYTDIEGVIKATEYPYVIPTEDLSLAQSIIRDADLMMALDDDWMNTIMTGLMKEANVYDMRVMVDGQFEFHKKIQMNSEWGKSVYRNRWHEVFNKLELLKSLL